MNFKRVSGRSTVIGILACLLMTMGAVVQAEIRFYKVDKHDGLKRQMFMRNDDKPGCHNAPGARKVHRVAVIDFAHCSVYAEKNCKDKTELPAYWKKKPDREKIKLTVGSRWYMNVDGADKNVKVRSWRCVK
ncbi:MAG: hypothetical protein GXP09_05620 [Gammaproteobacteria bacterium]|nr:hypothetical protein [Gammaproteobacteria bacterium]